MTRFLSTLVHHCFRILHTVLKMIVGLCNIVMLIVLPIVTGHKNFLLRPAHRSHEFGKRISGRQTLCTWYHGDQNEQRTQCLRNSTIFFFCLQFGFIDIFLIFFCSNLSLIFFPSFKQLQKIVHNKILSNDLLLKISHSYGIATLLHCVLYLRVACILADRCDLSTFILYRFYLKWI